MSQLFWLQTGLDSSFSLHNILLLALCAPPKNLSGGAHFIASAPGTKNPRYATDPIHPSASLTD